MSFFSDNLSIIVSTLFSAGGGGFLGWVTGRKREKSKDKEAESNALQQMQKAYDSFSIDMKEKYDELKLELKDIKAENKEQRRTLRLLQEDNSKLHVEISQLTRENHELKQMVSELRGENATLHEQLKKYRKK